MTVLEFISDVAAPGGVIVAVAALLWSWRQGRAERRHQLLAERYRALVDLLGAFELLEALRPTFAVWVAGENVDLEQAAATWRARLRASPEPLPISRSTLEHMPYGATDLEKQTLETAFQLGNPESEAELTMAVRGELVEALASLRKELGSSNDAGRLKTLSWRATDSP